METRESVYRGWGLAEFPMDGETTCRVMLLKDSIKQAYYPSELYRDGEEVDLAILAKDRDGILYMGGIHGILTGRTFTQLQTTFPAEHIQALALIISQVLLQEGMKEKPLISVWESNTMDAGIDEEQERLIFGSEGVLQKPNSRVKVINPFIRREVATGGFYSVFLE